MGVITISEDTDFQAELQKVAGTGKKIAVDFYAEWCGPCKVIGPKFAVMSEEPSYSNFVFLKIDVDGAEETAQSYGISAMPTFMMLDDKGTKLQEMVGASEAKLREMLDAHK